LQNEEWGFRNVLIINLFQNGQTGYGVMLHTLPITRFAL
jgi:hypothetical protein